VRLTKIDIDGFGLFSDKSFDKFSPNLNLFCGNNESGKSTLLAFIRYLFFDLPSKREKDVNIYEPSAGGKHGGKIVFIDGNGDEFTLVCNFAASKKDRFRLYKSHLKFDDRNSLHSILGIDKFYVYSNLFAFSLWELSKFKEFDELKKEEFLFGAQAGIDPIKLRQLEVELSEESFALYSKSSKSEKEINLILSSTEGILKRIDEKKACLDEYKQKKGELENIKNELSMNSEKGSELLDEKSRYEAFNKMFSIWCEYSRKEKELANMPIIEELFDKDLSPFEDFKRKGEELRKLTADNISKIEGFHDDSSNLDYNPFFLMNKDSIEDLDRKLESFNQNVERKKSITKDKLDKENSIKQLLLEIGSDWNEKKVVNFDLSLDNLDKVEKMKKNFKEVSEKRTGLERDLKNKMVSIKSTFDEIAKIEKKIKEIKTVSDVLDSEKLNKLKETRSEFKGAIRDLPVVLKDVERGLKDLENLIKKIFGDEKVNIIQLDFENYQKDLFNKNSPLKNLKNELVEYFSVLHASVKFEDMDEKYLSDKKEKIKSLKNLIHKLFLLGRDKNINDQAIESKERKLKGLWKFFAILSIFDISNRVAIIITCCSLLGSIILYFISHSMGIAVLPLIIAGVIWLFWFSNTIKLEVGVLLREIHIFKALKKNLDNENQDLQEKTKDILRALSLEVAPDNNEIDKIEASIEKQIEDLNRWHESKIQMDMILKNAERVIKMKKSIDDYSILAEELLNLRGIEFPNPEELEKTIDQFFKLIDDEIKKRRDLMNFKEQLKNEKGKLERFKEENQKLENQFESIKKVYSELEENWVNWLKSHCFEPYLTPEMVEKTLTRLESCKKEILSRDKCGKELAELEKNIEAYTYIARKLINELEGNVPIEKINDKVRYMLNELKKVQGIFNTKESIKKTIRLLEDDIHKWELELSENNKKEQTFILRNKTKDENDLREKFKIFNEREILKRELRDLMNKMCLIARSDNFEEIKEQIKNLHDIEFIRSRLSGLESEISQCEKEKKEMEEKSADLRKDIRDLENNDDLSKLYTVYEGLQFDLQVKFKKWLRCVMAAHLVKKAKEKYEKERQPGINKEAEKYFNLFTEGRYKKIISSLGQTGVSVVDNRENRIESKNLSRGTVEQLYLALRFGCIKERSKHSESIPIIMDDILVNFDPERTRNACKAILEFSKEHQILFFTCHPEIEQLFIDIDPDLRPFYMNQT
jgi:uncharacterized protein YhaN